MLSTPAQEHVKATTAPYKYPRKVEFVASGKIRRMELRHKEIQEIQD